MGVNMNYLDAIIERAHEAMGKKLTTKDRKKLKSSTFCGPGRSFPVPDCKHVAVAKAYLGKSKFSSATKSKIAACINRKAKALKCGGEKKAKAHAEDYLPKFIELSAEEKKIYSSDIFAETRQLVEDSLKTPDMELNWTEVEEEIEE
jgi:hypothetical protein